jgi:hypothetical protein
MTRSAGLIFTGTVTSITPVRARGSDSVDSVQVTFRVEQSVRGPRAGQTLTIREWSGLWSAGPRYRVGEHLMLFFYPPGKVGLTTDQGTPDQLRNSPGPRKARFLLYGIVLGVLLSPIVWAAQGATVDLPLTARLLSNGVPVSGKTINFQVGVGSGTANPPQS